QQGALLDRFAKADVNFRNAPNNLGNNRDGSEEQRRRGGRGVKIEDHGDEADRQHQTAGNAPSQLEPYGKERDFLAEPFSLAVASVEIIRKQCEQRAEDKLKHGRGLFFWK